jgi:hypothetical protein
MTSTCDDEPSNNINSLHMERMCLARLVYTHRVFKKKKVLTDSKSKYTSEYREHYMIPVSISINQTACSRICSSLMFIGNYYKCCYLSMKYKAPTSYPLMNPLEHVWHILPW